MVSRAPITGLWLSTVPSATNGTELATVEFRDALALRYGNIPADLPLICDGCGQQNSVSHSLDCKHGGLIHQRHDEIKREVEDLAIRDLSDGAVRDEPLITFSQNQHHKEGPIIHENRGDILIRGLWRKGEECILDIQVTNLDAHSYKSRNDESILLGLEKRKKGKYEKDCRDVRRSFSPLIVSEDGLQGRITKGILRRISKMLAAKWQRAYSVVCGYVRTRFSIAVVRATKRCLRGSQIPEKLISSQRQDWDNGVGLCLFPSVV